MPKFLITWNVGYGESVEVAVAPSKERADEVAYEAWKEEAENQSDYSAEPLTQELAELHGFWSEDDGPFDPDAIEETY